MLHSSILSYLLFNCLLVLNIVQFEGIFRLFKHLIFLLLQRIVEKTETFVLIKQERCISCLEIQDFFWWRGVGLVCILGSTPGHSSSKLFLKFEMQLF